MLKILYVGCFGLSPAISAQFTFKLRVAARNCQKSSKVIAFSINHKRVYDFFSVMVILALSCTVFEIEWLIG